GHAEARQCHCNGSAAVRRGGGPAFVPDAKTAVPHRREARSSTIGNDMTEKLPLTPITTSDAALGDVVYSVLGTAIRDGVLPAGRRLRDVEVAEALGVSRTPVREALQRLARIGLVEVSASRYTKVAQHDDALFT